MTLQDIMDLELNTNVSYAGFKGLLFKGKDDKHVVLEDKTGFRKRIYIELFAKYGKVI